MAGTGKCYIKCGSAGSERQMAHALSPVQVPVSCFYIRVFTWKWVAVRRPARGPWEGRSGWWMGLGRIACGMKEKDTGTEGCTGGGMGRRTAERWGTGGIVQSQLSHLPSFQMQNSANQCFVPSGQLVATVLHFRFFKDYLTGSYIYIMNFSCVCPQFSSLLLPCLRNPLLNRSPLYIKELS